MQAGLDVDAFAPRLSFFFNAHIDFFEEIAKYRAARRIWARWMRDRYGAQRERSLQMRFHTQTAGVSLTAQQPEVNIVRTAIEALAGVLGGTQSLHTNSMDETLALPTEKAARIALRTQQVIAHETRVANVADPLGGSWYVEALTDEMERRAEEIFAQIDEMGDGSMLDGAVRGVEEGWYQARDRRLRVRARAQAQRGPARGRRRERVPRGQRRAAAARPCASVPRSKRSSGAGSRRCARERDADAVERALARVRADAAEPTVNLMPALLDARPRVRDARRDRRRAGVGVRPLGRAAADLTGGDRVRAPRPRRRSRPHRAAARRSCATIDGLTEKSRGVFYRRSRACLHFHADGDDTYADVRFDGDEFERTRATTKAEQTRAALPRSGGALA